MKRKGSDFAGFFSSVVATQQVTNLGEGWIIDFRIQDTPDHVTERVAGQEVASLWPGYRWLYWVPKHDESTCLVFLNAQGHPVWCYADVIAGVSVDERGYPSTDDAYLDVVALCSVDDGRWTSREAEVIDHDDLSQALMSGTITAREAGRAEEVALAVQTALNQSRYGPLERLRAWAARDG